MRGDRRIRPEAGSRSRTPGRAFTGSYAQPPTLDPPLSCSLFACMRFAVMRSVLPLFALAVPASAGNEPPATTRPPRAESAPKPDLDRPATATKPVDGKTLCTYVSADPNAPSQRGDCVA